MILNVPATLARIAVETDIGKLMTVCNNAAERGIVEVVQAATDRINFLQPHDNAKGEPRQIGDWIARYLSPTPATPWLMNLYRNGVFVTEAPVSGPEECNEGEQILWFRQQDVNAALRYANMKNFLVVLRDGTGDLGPCRAIMRVAPISQPKFSKRPTRKGGKLTPLYSFVAKTIETVAVN